MTILWFSPCLLPFLGFTWGARIWARRRYEKDISDTNDLRLQLQNRNDTVKQRDASIATLETQAAEMLAKTPESFLSAQATNLKYDNLEITISDAQDYVARQEEALFEAHKTIANAYVLETAEDGAAAFEAAAPSQLAALAQRPRDTELRELINELEHASAAAATGAKVRLNEETREVRREQRIRLPKDLDALSKLFFEARTLGRYRLMLRYADHGLRMAKRAGGQGTQDSLMFARHHAEAMYYCGFPQVAFEELEILTPAITKAFGENHAATLYAVVWSQNS